MNSTHLNEFHLSNNPNLFALSLGEIAWFSIALIFFLVAWAVGGSDFKESIGGNYSLAILALGIAIGTTFATLTKPKS